MPPVLALYEDVFSNAATLALPPMPRLVFLVHGGGPPPLTQNGLP